MIPESVRRIQAYVSNRPDPFRRTGVSGIRNGRGMPFGRGEGRMPPGSPAAYHVKVTESHKNPRARSRFIYKSVI